MQLSLPASIFALTTAATFVAPLASASTATRQLKTAYKSVCESTIEYSYDSDAVSSASTTVAYAGAPWIQLDLTSTELGNNAKLVITGSSGSQELDATGLASSNGFSAVFDGDSVDVELITPGNRVRGNRANNSRVVVSALKVGLCGEKKPTTGQSICGNVDDRVPSDDPRQGRIGGCTGWLVSENVFIQAGEFVCLSGVYHIVLVTKCAHQYSHIHIINILFQDTAELQAPLLAFTSRTESPTLPQKISTRLTYPPTKV